MQLEFTDEHTSYSNIPTESLNSTVGEIAFAALCRLQNEPARLKSYFLKGYSLVVSMTLPITIASNPFRRGHYFRSPRTEMA